ncbi:MAG: hypothetical protein FJZ01_27305 [Candidatus Sericytochromatia bacterium]|nr:hypothetical protein [Candidatus Tanganyikabacteria bacterium]
MRIGLIGQAGEPHCLQVQRALASLGAEGVLIDASNFDAERRFGQDEACLLYNGEDAESFGAFYLRSILSPVPTVYVEDDQYKLYEDWHQSYMLAREKHGFLLAWLLGLMAAGRPVINPPHLGTLSLLKPYQLLRLKQQGFPTPRTLVTNDPAAAREFVARVGAAIAKPVIGGAFAQEVTPATLERLDMIRTAPVTFQERIAGPDIRVTAVAGQILSSVEIESDVLDFRAAEGYERGDGNLTPAPLPDPVARMVLAAMEASHLGFSAVDLKRRGPDDYVILELNFSPAFLWIEARTGHPISEGLARYLLACAEFAERERAGSAETASRPAPREAPVGDAPPRRQDLNTFFEFGVPKPSSVAGYFGA